MNYKNRKWQHEYDYCHHTLYGCGLPHGWFPLGGDGESGHTKHIIFLYNIKQQWPHPFLIHQMATHATPSTVHCLYINIWAEIVAAKSFSRSFIQHGAEKGRRRGGRRRKGWFAGLKGRRRVSVCSSLIFCETCEVILIWSGTSLRISWASWSAISWIVWVCEVRVI